MVYIFASYELLLLANFFYLWKHILSSATIHDEDILDRYFCITVSFFFKHYPCFYCVLNTTSIICIAKCILNIHRSIYQMRDRRSFREISEGQCVLDMSLLESRVVLALWRTVLCAITNDKQIELLVYFFNLFESLLSWLMLDTFVSRVRGLVDIEEEVNLSCLLLETETQNYLSYYQLVENIRKLNNNTARYINCNYCTYYFLKIILVYCIE